MEGKTWYHCRFNTITEELSSVHLGRANPDDDMNRGIQFEFWVPGSAAQLRGRQVYIFDSAAGWRDGLEVHLESAFPETKGIQAAIVKKIKSELKDSYEFTSLGRQEYNDFFKAIPSLKNGDHKVLVDPSDQTGYEKTEELGLHEDFAWSYNFAFIARVTLP